MDNKRGEYVRWLSIFSNYFQTRCIKHIILKHDSDLDSELIVKLFFPIIFRQDVLNKSVNNMMVTLMAIIGKQTVTKRVQYPATFINPVQKSFKNPSS